MRQRGKLKALTSHPSRSASCGPHQQVLYPSFAAMCKHVCQTGPWTAWPQAGNKTGLLYHAWLCHWTHDNPPTSTHFSSESSLFFKKIFGDRVLTCIPATWNPRSYWLQSPKCEITACLSLRSNSLPHVLYLQPALEPWLQPFPSNSFGSQGPVSWSVAPRQAQPAHSTYWDPNPVPTQSPVTGTTYPGKCLPE